MIERVHEHLLGELRLNTRTDTIFIIVAILLNLSILGSNTAVGSWETESYSPTTSLTEGSHTLYVEVLEEDRWWVPAARGSVKIEYGDGNEIEGTEIEEISDGPWKWQIPRKSVNVRYRLDGGDENGWAMIPAEDSNRATQMSVMFILFFLSVLLNFVVILGLLKGKKMRILLLNGLIQMYKDQKVAAYYDESLLKSYSIRYYLFISIVVFIGIISVAIPLIVRYL